MLQMNPHPSMEVWRGRYILRLTHTFLRGVQDWDLEKVADIMSMFNEARGHVVEKNYFIKAGQVYSFNLLDIERDYLSMDRRYTRLYVSPECAKVVVNWSREDLNIPLKTPITFDCS
ncbi:cell division cycle and apoptosis regulator protein 1 [Tanacetum coccineum]|uniref:Cell division cycle and apoptosis regulator protein 1 n=1 Tax=Tanacetum coccineum TaxID=301880 RepID=A0ABQ5IW06_9ASTR